MKSFWVIFFKEQLGAIQREAYLIPLIAMAFVFYIASQSYFLPIYYEYTTRKFRWSLTTTAIVFGKIAGFFWDGLHGGMIEVATLKCRSSCFGLTPVTIPSKEPSLPYGLHLLS